MFNKLKENYQKYKEDNYCENFQDVINTLIWQILPIPVKIAWNKISTRFYELRQSFVNWRNGYGFFPDYHAYSFCNTHADWILPRLKLFRDNTAKEVFHHIPEWVEEDEQQKNRIMFDDKITDEEFEKLKETWLAALDEMIFAFECETDKSPIWNNIHKRTTEEIQMMQDRAEKGMQLFAKYYGNLWD